MRTNGAVPWTLFRQFAPLVLARLSLKIIVGTATGAQVWTIGLLVDTLADGGDLFWPVALQAAALSLSGIENTLTPLFMHLQEHKVSVTLKKMVLSWVSEANVEDLDTLTTSGDAAVLQRSVSEASSSLDALLSLIERVVYLSTICFVIARLGRASLAVAVASLVPAAITSARSAKRQEAVVRSCAPDGAYGEYLLSLVCDRATAEETRWFNLGEYFVSLRDRVVTGTDRKVSMASRKSAMWTILSATLATIGLVSIMVTGIGRFLRSEISLGVALGAISGVLRLMQGGVNLARVIPMLAVDARAAAHAWRDLRKAIRIPSSQEESLPPQIPRGQDFVVTGVSFRYKDSPSNALTEVSLEIAQGETIAIVGPNGSGKSTLIKSLAGIITPSDGVILRSGRRFSVVWQDSARFEFTVRENISFGDPERKEQVEVSLYEAAEAAGLSVDEIGGLNQNLGTLRPNARGLSTGQWQRLALARGLYRGAPIVIMDEPTSFMDPESEVAFYKTVFRGCCGKTVIIASHRLGVARMANRVFVLDSGRLVEKGNHAELMSLGGRYAAMYGSQSQWYEMDGGHGHE